MPRRLSRGGCSPRLAGSFSDHSKSSERRSSETQVHGIGHLGPRCVRGDWRRSRRRRRLHVRKINTGPIDRHSWQSATLTNNVGESSPSSRGRPERSCSPWTRLPSSRFRASDLCIGHPLGCSPCSVSFRALVDLTPVRQGLKSSDDETLREVHWETPLRRAVGRPFAQGGRFRTGEVRHDVVDWAHNGADIQASTSRSGVMVRNDESFYFRLASPVRWSLVVRWAHGSWAGPFSVFRTASPAHSGRVQRRGTAVFADGVVSPACCDARREVPIRLRAAHAVPSNWSTPDAIGEPQST